MDWFSYVSLLQWDVSNHEVSLLCFTSLWFWCIHRNWSHQTSVWNCAICYVLHHYDSDAFTETGLIKPVYEIVRYVLNTCISFLTNVLTSSFPQSMIARLVLNLLKSHEIIAMLQWSKAFDAFPLWQSQIFLNV